MSNSDNLKKKTKKALKALYQSIQSDVQGIIKYCMKHSSDLDMAYYGAPTKIIIGLFNQYNTNLHHVEEFINFKFFMNIEHSNNNK